MRWDERRFIKTPEPYTFEFKRVVVAMNALADRVKAMLEQEAETLNEYRQELQEDKVTKLLNRDHFMTVFKSTLQRDDSTGAGAIAIMRITELVAAEQHLWLSKGRRHAGGSWQPNPLAGQYQRRLDGIAAQRLRLYGIGTGLKTTL